MNQTKIRLMKEEDLDVLAKIYVDAYDNADIGEKWNERSARALINYWMKKQPDLAFVAEFEDEIAGGLISGIKPWWDGNRLSDGELFVAPRFQKKGIGTALMKELCEKAISKYNAVSLDAFTYKKNKFPLAWYKTIGFEEVNGWAIVSANLKELKERLDKR
jgi:aminoglycoside 6'-N-acetyltransferase I